MTEPLLVSPREAAAILGIGRDACYQLIREGRLPTLKVGRSIKVPRIALSRFVEQVAPENGEARR